MDIRDAAQKIRNGEPIEIDGLKGFAPEDKGKYFKAPTPLWHSTDATHYYADAHTYGIAYLVLSYGTPIGWVCNDGSDVVVETLYGPSITRHQYLVREAWGLDRD